MLIDIISFERNSFIMRKFSKKNFFYKEIRYFNKFIKIHYFSTLIRNHYFN